LAEETALIVLQFPNLEIRNAALMRHCNVILFLIAILFLGTRAAQSASAVAIGVGSDGKLKCGSSWGRPSEAEAKRRALGFCMVLGGVNPTIIASTSKRGFGVIMKYQRSDGKIGITASVGAATQQDAINDAARKAKSAGGSKAEVAREWNDIPKTVIKL
jgi:hypothetical protein